MTRRDYIKLANDIRIEHNNASSKDVAKGIRLATLCVCDALQRNNPSFDRQRFLAACEMYDMRFVGKDT